ncbi:MAG: hypothetical protein GC158_10480 [Cyanobacteria bacterium RI_101]|nr:hypothetical protein [Cyanobacteria bacterium RI_101]
MKPLALGAIPQALRDQLSIFRAKRRLTSPRVAANAVGEVNAYWRARIDDVIACPDNARIPRDPGAGQLEGYTITMHNGVRVCADGYYGAGNLNMLIENKGVHEPQEEYAFAQVIELLPEECVMLELGAYWGFYSLSLLQRRPKAACFLVEPELRNLVSGKLNFRLNGRKGHFTQARVGQAPQTHPKTISVDSFCAERGIQHLHILHSDIQGHEVAMLEGASHFLGEGKADFLFLSTHSNELHRSCLDKLKTFGYVILADADKDETFSFDGLIVAKRQSLKEPQSIEISKKGISQDKS